MMRARYGTGVFLNLEKRECNIHIELTPDSEWLGYLQIDLQIYEDHYVMYPSSTVSRQFSLFLRSLYCLYSEEQDDHYYHNNWRKTITYNLSDNGKRESITTQMGFDEEGRVTDITLERFCTPDDLYLYPSGKDKMVLSIISPHNGHGSYEIDGRDLCYAVAKACTKAIKKYGYFGYGLNTACLHSSDRDDFNINELLFIKAYALNAMEVRDLHEVMLRKKIGPGYEVNNKYYSVVASSFEKELELLLFDM